MIAAAVVAVVVAVDVDVVDVFDVADVVVDVAVDCCLHVVENMKSNAGSDNVGSSITA